MKTETTKHIVLDAGKWPQIYIIADFTVAFVLVTVAMISAEIPRQRITIVRHAAPYTARGWKPTGQQLNLPLRAQPPAPAASYGPPPEAEATTTEQATTTEATTEDVASQQVENIEVEPESDKPKPEKLEEESRQFFVVLPQGQNLLYTVPQSASLIAVPRGNLMVAPARLQTLPVSSAVASAVYTPYSASYVQIYQ